MEYKLSNTSVDQLHGSQTPDLGRIQQECSFSGEAHPLLIHAIWIACVAQGPVHVC